MVTDAQVNVALVTWNTMQGSDRVVLRQILTDFEAMQKDAPEQEPEVNPAELGSITLTLSVAEDGKLTMGTEASGHLDYFNIRAMLAMASETGSVERMVGEMS